MGLQEGVVIQRLVRRRARKVECGDDYLGRIKLLKKQDGRDVRP